MSVRRMSSCVLFAPSHIFEPLQFDLIFLDFATSICVLPDLPSKQCRTLLSSFKKCNGIVASWEVCYCPARNRTGGKTRYSACWERHDGSCGKHAQSPDPKAAIPSC